MRENGIIFSRQSPIISSSDIERMSYIDLIFMQKNLKIISQIRILTARAFKSSLAREGGRAGQIVGQEMWDHLLQFRLKTSPV